MKKLFLFMGVALALCAMPGTLRAQTFRIEAGYLQPVRRSNTISPQHLNGIRVGGTVDFDIPKVSFLSIHTGLLYSFTFGKDSQMYPQINTSDSIRINNRQGHFLDIPVHVVASYTLFKNKVKVFAFAGPNFNIGLYQQQRVETNATDGEVLQAIRDNGYYIGTRNLYPDRLRRFNFQLEAGGGFEWWKLQVKGGYSFGLNNISKLGLEEDERERQSGWFVSLAYTL